MHPFYHCIYTCTDSSLFFFLPPSNIQFSPKLTPHDREYVHHMLVYICDSLNETDIGNGANCDDVTESVDDCKVQLISAWAVGGEVRAM